MRQYTLVFMEQRVGMLQLIPMEGEQGVSSFMAVDDEAALAYVREHLLERLKICARAGLSSLRVVTDSKSSGGQRLVDDTHANPRFQEMYIRYNTVTKAVEVDWDSTRTALIADPPSLRAASAPRQ